MSAINGSRAFRHYNLEKLIVPKSIRAEPLLQSFDTALPDFSKPPHEWYSIKSIPYQFGISFWGISGGTIVEHMNFWYLHRVPYSDLRQVFTNLHQYHFAQPKSILDPDNFINEYNYKNIRKTLSRINE